MAKIRSFVAIALPDHLKKKLEDGQNDLRSQIDGVKWVSLNSMHITLKFVGNIDEGLIEKMSEALKLCVNDLAPFEIEVKNIGCFPTLKRPRIIWAGIENIILPEINKKIEQAFEPMGIKRENRYRSHITLGRVKKNLSDNMKDCVEQYKDRSFGKFTADSLVIYQSILSKQGAQYLPLANIEFGR